jgi:hypothetical protein
VQRWRRCRVGIPSRHRNENAYASCRRRRGRRHVRETRSGPHRRTGCCSRTPKGRRSRYCPRLDADPGAEGAETSSRRSTSGAMKLSIVSTEVSLLKNREADCITVLVQCARASWPTYRTKGQLWGSRWCGRHDRRNRGSSAPSDACEPSRGRPLGCRRITRGVRMDGLRCVAVLRWDELRRNAR